MQKLKLLIAAPPGLMRNSLVAYLRALPEIGQIHLADNLSGIQPLISDLCPDGIILDAAVGEPESLELIRWVRVELPDARCVALADSVSQIQNLHTAGANGALLKGLLDGRLRDILLFH